MFFSTIVSLLCKRNPYLVSRTVRRLNHADAVQSFVVPVPVDKRVIPGQRFLKSVQPLAGNSHLRQFGDLGRHRQISICDGIVQPQPSRPQTARQELSDRESLSLPEKPTCRFPADEPRLHNRVDRWDHRDRDSDIRRRGSPRFRSSLSQAPRHEPRKGLGLRRLTEKPPGRDSEFGNPLHLDGPTCLAPRFPLFALPQGTRSTGPLYHRQRWN
jgi:hypothetical protein